jgi:peptide deformylase
MALLKIARMGHPVLRSPAAPVANPTAPEIARLVADMMETLAESGGVGLAAPQVHVPLRVVLISVPALRGGEDEALPPTVLINPEVEAIGDAMATVVEGCLSLPGMIGQVPRPARIRYRALGRDGAPVEREVGGFHARVVQHEVDHLDGLLYPMRMTDLRSFGYVEEVRKGLQQDGKGPE